MNSKLSKISNEKLEKRLAKLEKYQKMLNWIIIAAIILFVLSFLSENEMEFHLGSPLSIFILTLIMKFIIYPTQIGTLKTEINDRKNMKQNLN